MTCPNKWKLIDLITYLKESDVSVGIELEPNKTEWFPARPEGFPSLKNRITSAWMVFTGRADVLQWPYQ